MALSGTGESSLDKGGLHLDSPCGLQNTSEHRKPSSQWVMKPICSGPHSKDLFNQMYDFYIPSESFPPCSVFLKCSLALDPSYCCYYTAIVRTIWLTLALALTLLSTRSLSTSFVFIYFVSHSQLKSHLADASDAGQNALVLALP